METIGISCSCGNTEAFKLSQKAAECTSCSTLHTITDEPVFITRSITPLHVIEQRAKDQAIKDMLVEEAFQKGAGGNIRHDENIDRIINGIKSIIQNNPDIGAMNAMKMYIEMVGSDFDRWLETESPEPVGAR